jgi:protein O-mannosyl-transferase
MTRTTTRTLRDWALGLLLLLATLAAYQPAWQGQPLWDDDISITPQGLRSWDGLGSIWTKPGTTMQYYPLTYSLFWLQVHLWGESTFGYHIINILLHGLSALLLVRLLRRLEIPGAWLAGGLFALHPVMVQSVAWISELKNTLSGVLFLSAALLYLNQGETQRRRRYGFSLILYLLGLLAKTAVAPLPLVLLAVITWKRGRLAWRRDVVPLLPFAGLGLLMGLFTLHVEHTLVRAEGPAFAFSLGDRLEIAGRAVLFYLGKLLWPAHLSFIYPRWDLANPSGWRFLWPLAVVAVAAILWAIRRRARAPLAAFFAFFAMLIPVSGFFAIYAFSYSFVADRWQYLASIAPLVLIAAGLTRVFSGATSRRFLVPTAALILILCGVATARASATYANAETLYRTTLASNPGCWLAHGNLGVLLANAGRTDEAIDHYQQALTLHPDFARAHGNLGNALMVVGRRDEALTHYQKSLQIDPSDAMVHLNFGNLLLQLGRGDDALTHYQTAARLQPNDPRVQIYLGNLYLERGQRDQALVSYRQAVQRDPDHAEAHSQLARALAEAGESEPAETHFRAALRLSPNHTPALAGLARIALKSSRAAEAIDLYVRASQAAPADIGILVNLALALVHEQQWAEAASVLQRASSLAKSPQDVERIRATFQMVTRLYQTAEALRAQTPPAGP